MSTGSPTPPPPPTRARVLAIARSFIGTPYHHQASVRGAGCDCIGLVRGIWRDLYGREATESLPGYTRDWAEATGQETLLGAAATHLVPVPVSAARPGDVLVFRYRPGLIAKHTGILASAGDPPRLSLIHAVEGAPVCEVPLSTWWTRRIAGAFAFPGIIA